MNERCKECGTPVNEVPLVECVTHSQVALEDTLQQHRESREGRIEYLEGMINKLPRTGDMLTLRLILREIVRLL